MSVSSTSKVSQMACRAGSDCGRHGQHHALLGFGEPDFPGRQAGVFERHVAQVDVGADAAGHLAHRRGKPARAAVGDGVIQALVAGAHDHLDQPFLGDRIADLHRSARRPRRSGRPWSCEEKVAPRRPSRPVRPPRTMTRSPGCGLRGWLPLGAMPTQPQKTSGLAV